MEKYRHMSRNILNERRKKKHSMKWLRAWLTFWNLNSPQNILMFFAYNFYWEFRTTVQKRYFLYYDLIHNSTKFHFNIRCSFSVIMKHKIMIFVFHLSKKIQQILAQKFCWIMYKIIIKKISFEPCDRNSQTKVISKNIKYFGRTIQI